jgi:AraC family transcriptional regulator of adaptative response/methylated-DNA-[protein]-cysteine methyltransferase
VRFLPQRQGTGLVTHEAHADRLVLAGEASGDQLGASLIEALAREFPEAALERDQLRLEPSLRAVLQGLSGKTPSRTLPLDIQATAFERKVWDALLRIPRGETRSYAGIAREVGVPGGARAVARACAKNRLAALAAAARSRAGTNRP